MAYCTDNRYCLVSIFQHICLLIMCDSFESFVFIYGGNHKTVITSSLWPIFAEGG